MQTEYWLKNLEGRGKNWVTPLKMEPAFKSFIKKREGTTHKAQVQMR
jgi:hypothetical protein